MPWIEESVMNQRVKLVEKMLLPEANVSDICKDLGISRKTAYKWLRRYCDGGIEALQDKSREPHQQPNKAKREAENLIVSLHKQYPYWGPRKLRDYLINVENIKDIPSHTTVDRILKRNECYVIKNNKSNAAKSRFERKIANDLWQMDFKGSFMTDKYRCYPLTILDDYSRYSIGLRACTNEQSITVKEHLIEIFKTYGLPNQINVDNGNPWSSSDLESKTSLQIWLFKLGILVSHSAPYHPQTNGKDERFHKTLKLEVLHDRKYHDIHEMQAVFDKWRHIYNYKRPHAALDGKPPSSRYMVSNKSYPSCILEPEYEIGDVVRKVHADIGTIRFKGKRYHAGKGLCGEYVAIKETEKSNIYAIFFMDQFIKKINLEQGV